MHEKVKALLTKYEGLRLHPYKDTVGKTTIAIGRNLDDVGLFLDEVDLMANNDIARSYTQARNNYPWFMDLDEVRQAVVLMMIFQLGLYGFNQFKETIKAISERDYYKAAEKMLDSTWSKQTSKRALEMSEMMRRGTWPEESH